MKTPLRSPAWSFPARIRWLAVAGLLAGTGAIAEAGVGDAAAPGDPAAATPPAATPALDKAVVLARLGRLSQSGQFLFGQQNATLWGMYAKGAVVSTNAWFDATARAGHFTSDSEAVVGDHPAILGFGLDMLAFEPVAWKRRSVVAAAVRRQFAQGGLVTTDWHAPSCNSAIRSAGPLAQVSVDGHEVALLSVAGGSDFNADEEYTRPITSHADVPETLKCLCQIANDLPLSAGPYKGVGGITGKTWLIAHAKQAARVLREQGLADLPIIVRPFHEHNGNWFWWGQPYWNCAALLDRPDAVTGPEAYKTAVRTFISALRAEPGMGNLIFAYATDKLLGDNEDEHFTPTQDKVADPEAKARDLLRARLVHELTAAGLAYVSPAQRAATLPWSRATSAKRTGQYIAQRRRYYTEAYAGDDVFDVLGIDLYHPVARAANSSDLRLYRLQLRALAEEARTRRKPYAITETGSYRLRLGALAGKAAPGTPLTISGKASIDEALARLFDPADRAALLRNFGLAAAGPVVLDPAERAAVVPTASEDWFGRQLLVLAKEAKVAYALVWQTYFDSAWTDRYFYYYVPYPGHPDAASYQRFYADKATCFLRDACAAEPPHQTSDR